MERRRRRKNATRKKKKKQGRQKEPSRVRTEAVEALSKDLVLLPGLYLDAVDFDEERHHKVDDDGYEEVSNCNLSCGNQETAPIQRKHPARLPKPRDFVLQKLCPTTLNYCLWILSTSQRDFNWLYCFTYIALLVLCCSTDGAV